MLAIPETLPHPSHFSTDATEILLAWEPDGKELLSDVVPDFGGVRGGAPKRGEAETTGSDAGGDFPPIIHSALIAQNDISNSISSGAIYYSSDGSESSCPSASSALSEAQALWDAPETQNQAIEVLKNARKCDPGSQEINFALGIAYSKVNNYSWALRTFNAILSQSPEDCQTRAWMAWIYIQMAMPGEADNILRSAQCDEGSQQGRLELLRAMNGLAQNDRDMAAGALERAYHADRLARSDLNAMNAMRSSVGISKDPNFTWKIDIDGGYASNALSGSPNDPSLFEKKLASPLIDGDIRLSLDPWSEAFARPVLELQATGQVLTTKDTIDSSYIDLSMRLGIRADTDHLKFGAYYRPEYLIMAGGDIYDEGPVIFYSSHRIELDFEIHQWLYLFGGYGHRTFRQRVRTRDEIDLGLGGHHNLGKGVALTWGGTYRHWFSYGDMYKLNGVNLSLALDYRIQKIDMLFRLSGAFSYDDYPESFNYFDSDVMRNDKALRGTFQFWSPSWSGVRVGAIVKASHRWSSAPSYSYEDYRGMAAIRWTGNLDFYAPRSIDDDISALPWDFESGSSTERIRDIIQQDEDMQRSSSCLQN